MSNIDIGFYLAILKRRLPYLLLITLSALLAATIVARILPPVYSATARILAEAPQIPTDLARSTVPLGASAQLLILQQEMTTRDALITLAKKQDIYRDSKALPSDEDIVKDLRARIKFDQAMLDPNDPGQGVAIFAVSFTATTPTLAATVTNTLSEMILARNHRERTDQASNTLQFFDHKVTSLDSALRKIEADLLVFKTEHKDTLPESLDFHRSQQSSLQERLLSLEREESELRTRRNTLIVTYTATGQLAGTVPLTPEQQMLAEMNQALAQQLTMFTEDSPNIVAIRARIDKLQKALVAQRTTAPKQDDAVSDKAPFGLELQLSDIDERLKAIARERAMVTKRVDDLTHSIAETPATETALNSLLRNRENIQAQYNAAIARRAEAFTGEQIEMRADGERFSLLEAAAQPTKPISPKRKMIVALGGMGGLGLGLALIVLLEILNRTVRRPADLTKLLQNPPLGAIPVIVTRREIRTARIRLGIAALVSAAVIPASLAAIHFYYMPLNILFQKAAWGLGWMGAA